MIGSDNCFEFFGGKPGPDINFKSLGLKYFNAGFPEIVTDKYFH
jgi:hypothetical protein